jgi:hypothetical protein
MPVLLPSNLTTPVARATTDGILMFDPTLERPLVSIDGAFYPIAIQDDIPAPGGIADGDKGDITVTASGATWTIDNAVVTLAKMADVATGTVFYRKTAGTGAPEVQTIATLKADLGLTGTNSGDQTTIVGITGTKAQFNTALTDGDFLYVGDVTSNATHTGDVTGSGALTVDKTAITGKTLVTAAADDHVLVADASDSDNLKKVTVQTIVDLAGGASTIYYGHLQADYTLTSTTAAQKLFNWSTNGALTLPTGIYRFRAMIYLTTMSATSGNAAFGIRGAGTATIARVLYHVTGFDNSSPLNAGARGGSAAIASASPASMVTAGTGTGLVALIEGFFDVTAAGTIIPSIALVTAAAAVVKAGSFFECERVGDTATGASSGWT